MIAYALFITFAFGMLLGSNITVATRIYTQKRRIEKLVPRSASNVVVKDDISQHLYSTK